MYRAILDHSACSGQEGDGLDAEPRRLVPAYEARARCHVLDVDGFFASEGFGHHVVTSLVKEHVSAGVRVTKLLRSPIFTRLALRAGVT